MARILVAIQRLRLSQWMEVDDADGLRQRIVSMSGAASSNNYPKSGAVEPQDWTALAYEGLPDFGPRPDLNELLAYLDAVDDYGEPFEKLWISRSFDGVLQAADMFADIYQGHYTDAGAWARHYLALIGATTGPDFDFDAYGHAAASKGDVWFVAADNGGIHAFWTD